MSLQMFSASRETPAAKNASQQKSAVAPVAERKFLGYRFAADGTLGIAPKSLVRTNARLRQITKRNPAVSLGQMIDEAHEHLAKPLASL
jgi:hypothetical protein